MTNLPSLLEGLRDLTEAKGKRPPKSQIDKLVQAYGKLLYASRVAPGTRDRERMYNAFWKLHERMSTKYPHVDMTSRDFWRALENKAREWERKQTFKGPGVWW